MSNMTVSNGNSFLETGRLDFKQTQPSSLKIDSTSEVSFGETLKNAIGEVNQLQKKSDVAMQELATGKTDNVHDVMIAAEKADIALKLMVGVRNKIIDAYSEIMRMQV